MIISYNLFCKLKIKSTKKIPLHKLRKLFNVANQTIHLRRFSGPNGKSITPTICRSQSNNNAHLRAFGKEKFVQKFNLIFRLNFVLKVATTVAVQSVEILMLARSYGIIAWIICWWKILLPLNCWNFCLFATT